MARAIINSLEHIVYVWPDRRTTALINDTYVWPDFFTTSISHDIISERVNHIPFSLIYNSKNDFKTL